MLIPQFEGILNRIFQLFQWWHINAHRITKLALKLRKYKKFQKGLKFNIPKSCLKNAY